MANNPYNPRAYPPAPDPNYDYQPNNLYQGREQPVPNQPQPGYSEQPIPQSYPNQAQFNLAFNQGFGVVGQPPVGQNLPPNTKPKEPLNKRILDFLTKKWWLVALIVTLVSALVIGLVYFLSSPSENTEEISYKNVTAAIIAPKNLPQGSPGEWEIVVENKEPVSVNNILVELKFDPDFQYLREISPKPENPEGTKYSIARLDKAGDRSSSQKIRFAGILTGKADIEVEMQGSFTYQPEIATGRLGSVISQNIDPVRTKITSPQIDLTLTPTNEQVQNNGEAEFTVKINNRTDQGFTDLRLRMIYPSGRNSFTYTSSEYSAGNTAAPQTQPSSGDNTWTIARLPGGAEHVLRLRGKVLGASQAQLTFGAEVALKTKDNDYQVIRETYKDIRVQAQAIKLATKIQGKDQSKVVIPGETLTFEVTYQNEGQQTLNNVEIISFIEDASNLLDLTTLSFKSGERGDISENQIVWQGTRVPQLATLRPSQSGKFEYTIKVKQLDQFLNPNLNQTQYTIRPGVQVKAQNLDQIQYVGDLYKGKGELEFIQEDPVFKEISPTTGNNVFSFTWKLKTWQNEVTDVVIKSTSPLPPGSWTNKVTPEASSQALSYNQSNGEITWNAGKLSSYTGRGIPEVSITFEMEVPTTGRQIALTKPTITGVDVFTGEKFNYAGKDTEAWK